jgi:hypothetical protein
MLDISHPPKLVNVKYWLSESNSERKKQSDKSSEIIKNKKVSQI